MQLCKVEKNYNMTEKKDHNEIIQNITNEIWFLHKAFRGALNVEDFDVLLLIASAYKDDLIDQSVHNYYGAIQTLLLDRISKSDEYDSVLEIYEPIIRTLDSKIIEQMVHNILHVDPNVLKQYFSQIFDALLYRFSQTLGSKSGEFILPKEISYFIMEIANLDSNATVYNPFAGVASFATFLNANHRYYGQETNHRTWALGALRLMAYNLQHFDYKCENSVASWNNFSEFDLIVSYPPFNIKTPHYYSDNGSNSFGEFLISKSWTQLPKNGQLICILPLSFLFNNGKILKLRKELINSNFIDTVISLPAGLLKNTAIPFCIIIFKKSSNSDKIKLIDATDFAKIKTRKKEKTLDSASLLEIIKTDDEKFVKFVDLKTIQKNGYNLSVGRYFIDLNFYGYPIKKIATLINGSKAEKGNYGKLIKIKDLKQDIINYILDLGYIETKEIPNIGIRKIEQNCILIALRGIYLKPTFFLYQGEPIYISNDIIALRLNNELINVNYFVNELHADYVIDQIGNYRSGSIVPQLKKEDFIALQIEVPSIEEQNRKYYSFAKDYVESIVKESQHDFEANKINIEDENSFLRHQIAGTLKNIRGAFKFIQQILEEKVKIEFPDLYSLKANEALNSTLKTYLDIVERDLNSITKSVNQVGDKIELMDLKIESFDLLVFMREYHEDLKIRGKNFYTVSLDLDEDAIYEDGLLGVFIEGDKDILRKIFDNIIENAEKHAFAHGINNGNQNKINILLLYDFEDLTVQIDFRNTGNPLPENLTFESITRKGSSSGINSGNGIGVWFVNEVMKIHKGKFSFTDETGPEGIESEFVTTIELNFPIIPAI